jgi:hypothetical protein
MRAYFPEGVKKGHPAYASKHDREKEIGRVNDEKDVFI